MKTQTLRYLKVNLKYLSSCFRMFFLFTLNETQRKKTEACRWDKGRLLEGWVWLNLGPHLQRRRWSFPPSNSLRNKQLPLVNNSKGNLRKGLWFSISKYNWTVKYSRILMTLNFGHVWHSQGLVIFDNTWRKQSNISLSRTQCKPAIKSKGAPRN